MARNKDDEGKFGTYLQRYSSGEWRTLIFRDLVLADARQMQKARFGKGVFLDIGCGCGFDNDPRIQAQLAKASGQYIGIEPDTNIQLADFFSFVHRCCFEEAPILPDSVDIAFACMVLEHLADPQLFWEKVHNVLRRGGVFWGFTVDARHLFVRASLLAERLHIKDWYLNLLHGTRGEERYENYGVYYRSNTPRQIEQLTKTFSERSVLHFQRVGQLDYYLPPKLRWVNRSYDRLARLMGWPGSILAVRVEK